MNIRGIGEPMNNSVLFCEGDNKLPINQSLSDDPIPLNKSTMQSRKRRNHLREQGLCRMCGKRPPVFGYEHCAICRLQAHNRGINTRANNMMVRYDALLDKNLISVNEAEELLHVSFATVHKFIDKGLLTVKDTLDHSFYLSEHEVNILARKRPLLKCLDCGYEWHKRWFVADNRCHKKNCRSTHIVKMRTNSNHLITPSYQCTICQHKWKASKHIPLSKSSKLIFRKPKQCPVCHSRKWNSG